MVPNFQTDKYITDERLSQKQLSGANGNPGIQTFMKKLQIMCDKDPY